MNKQNIRVGVAVLLIVFIVLSMYQIFYVTNISSTLSHHFGDHEGFEQVYSGMTRVLDNLWLIDVAQVISAVLVIVGLFIGLRVKEFDEELKHVFSEERKIDSLQSKMVNYDLEIEQEKSLITDFELHKEEIKDISNHNDEHYYGDLLGYLSKIFKAGSGLAYHFADDLLHPIASYATPRMYTAYPTFDLGEGLVGEVGKSRNKIVVNDLHSDELEIETGLGNSIPMQVVIVPIRKGRSLIGVLELAFLKSLSQVDIEKLEELCKMEEIN